MAEPTWQSLSIEDGFNSKSKETTDLNKIVPISSINQVKTIVVPIPTGSSSIVPIYQSASPNTDYEVISYNCFIKNLKVFAQVHSLTESVMPDFDLTDSQTQKLYKVLDVEWKSQRKQLDLYIGTTDVDWQLIGSISLLNPAGYPYRIYSLMDIFTDNLAIELGDNAKLGIACKDVAYGLLTANDKVVVHGSYVEEIFVKTPETTVFNITVNGNSSAPASDYSIGNTAYLGNSFLAGN